MFSNAEDLSNKKAKDLHSKIWSHLLLLVLGLQDSQNWFTWNNIIWNPKININLLAIFAFTNYHQVYTLTLLMNFVFEIFFSSNLINSSHPANQEYFETSDFIVGDLFCNRRFWTFLYIQSVEEQFLIYSKKEEHNISTLSICGKWKIDEWLFCRLL